MSSKKHRVVMGSPFYAKYDILQGTLNAVRFIPIRGPLDLWTKSKLPNNLYDVVSDCVMLF
jgi:hypothetical protein